MTTAPLSRGEALRARSIPNRIRRAGGWLWNVVTGLDKPGVDWHGALYLFMWIAIIATFFAGFVAQSFWLLACMIALGVTTKRPERRED